jgi:hypothetical protein
MNHTNVKYMSMVPIYFDFLLCEGIKKRWIEKYFFGDATSKNHNRIQARNGRFPLLSGLRKGLALVDKYFN